MYIKNINNWLNENSKEGVIKVIFSELLHDCFDTNYYDMVSWLNRYGNGKRVWYISIKIDNNTKNNKIIKNNRINDSLHFFTVAQYETALNRDLIKIYMSDGQFGDAYGLVYLDDIDLPGDKYKKIKKIVNPEIDPYEEEDWGYEEI